MSYILRGDGTAQYMADTALPGSVTGLRLGPSGPVATTVEQVAELHQLTAENFTLYDAVSPAAVASTPLTPEQAGAHSLGVSLQQQAVRKALAADRADAKVEHELALRAGRQAIDESIKPDNRDSNRPHSYGEHEQRVQAACQAAARLGYVLAAVPGQAVQVQGLTGPYARNVYALVANAGNPLCERIEYGPDELHNIEARLEADMREYRRRASREAVEAGHAAAAPVARVITEQQAYDESGAGRLARIEAERDQMKAQLALLLAERTAV